MDIGRSSQPLALEDAAPDALVTCPNCQQKNTLVKLLTEQPLTPLEDGLMEGLLICPDCGHRTHCYYLSKELRQKRAMVFGMIKVLAKRRTPANFQKVRNLKENYKNLFDAEQAKYKELTEQEDGQAAA